MGFPAGGGLEGGLPKDCGSDQGACSAGRLCTGICSGVSLDCRRTVEFGMESHQPAAGKDSLQTSHDHHAASLVLQVKSL